MDIWDLLIEGHSSHVFPAQFLGHEYCIDLPFPFCKFNFFVHFFCIQNPPLELCLDGSTGASDDHEVEEGGDGVWSVVGGKVWLLPFLNWVS